MTKKQYFISLAKYSQILFDKLPIELEPKPISYALNILKPAIDNIKVSQLDELYKIRSLDKLATPGNTNSWQGLNSIGMLMDRFTILLIREWCLINKQKNGTKAKQIFELQTLDIIEAMVNAAPGSSALNSKITNIKQSVNASTWEQAFFGLLTINLILWESQEVLYIKDISKLPCEELRSYIDWFSKGNIIRNEYIQLCEELFWSI
ncbi:hypothetical protein [Pedobacter xixiisoli]|uniref:Uncharacterized protein n=1 Tax=Pedobacter xixiisoli TaxID=1476464 RepID=A0A286A9Q5_9SPHI|nr:hypothetical protein [Pedobacter xixiisoli]SOD18634.1 hypothetical protein SAMN06297358_3107 [Pedobacter xixiisoli]